ncbi:MAG: FAD binding domain-containing protein, partial [Beijerinckiaceae bacterium]
MLHETRAAVLSEALELIAREPGRRVLAGGTDVYPAEVARLAWFGAAAPPALDISRLSGLRGISHRAGHVRIGALTTWTDLIDADLPAAFAGLRQAARQVGGVQIQNRGTIGGNLCNASPAADGVPPLLALDATVELASASGSRAIPLSEFILGNRKTALRPGELLTAVLAPIPAAGERSVFLKLGARSYLVISIASVAANISLDAEGRIAAARIAVGACSAAPVRLTVLEARLAGERPGNVLIADGDLPELAPIDDVRASAAYRQAS